MDETLPFILKRTSRPDNVLHTGWTS